MYTIARDFDKKPKDEKKVRGYFEKYMGKKPNETEEQFFHRLFP